MASERKFIEEKMERVLLKEFLKDKSERAGFGGCEVSRTPMGTRITLHIERPALVIGRKGRNIRKLTSQVKEKFSFDNPQIEVQEVQVPELNPQIMAAKLANSLERGWHFRRAGHSTVRRIMQSGARGCQIILSGKITGPRHRVEKFVDGHIKHCGEEEKKWMHEGFSTAKVKLGVIGVTVQIMDPKARLPDEIDVIKVPEKEPKVEVTEDESEEEVVEEAEVTEDESEEDVVEEVEVTEDESEEEVVEEAEVTEDESAEDVADEETSSDDEDHTEGSEDEVEDDDGSESDDKEEVKEDASA